MAEYSDQRIRNLEKARSEEGSSVSFKHNLKGLLGIMLKDIMKSGEFDYDALEDMKNRASFEVGYDFSKDYGIKFGYNTRMGKEPMDYQLTFNKKIY